MTFRKQLLLTAEQGPGPEHPLLGVCRLARPHCPLSLACLSRRACIPPSKGAGQPAGPIWQGCSDPGHCSVGQLTCPTLPAGLPSSGVGVGVGTNGEAALEAAFLSPVLTALLLLGCWLSPPFSSSTIFSLLPSFLFPFSSSLY